MSVRVPKRVFRGLRLQLINKLFNALTSITAMDERTQLRNGIDPTINPEEFFAPTTGLKNAITALMSRISACRSAKS